MDRLSQTRKDINLSEMAGAAAGATTCSENRSGENSAKIGPSEAQGGAAGGMGVGVSVPSTSSAAMAGAAGGSDLTTSRFSEIFPLLQGYLSEESAMACRSVCKEWKAPVDRALSGGAAGDGPSQQSNDSSGL